MSDWKPDRNVVRIGLTKWRVVRARRKDGTLFRHPIWNIFLEGEWYGAFETWDEAIEWVTDPAQRVEWYANKMARR
jgi:hypothetical protein